MNRCIEATACVFFALTSGLAIGYEFPGCDQEQLISQLQALPLEDQLHTIHQVIQALPPELRPVRNLPAHEQPHISLQQLLEILQMLQDALDKEQNSPYDPVDGVN